MYTRVGRILFIVGHRQLTQKFCENKTCPPLGVWFMNKYGNPFVRRNYSDGSATGEDNNAKMTIDEEATLKLKDYLASPDNVKVYKIIELEIEMLRQNNEKVPDLLRPSNWYELVNLDSCSKRKRYLAFLWSVERKKANRKASKELKRQQLDEREAPTTPYRLGNNTMFLRIYEATMNHFWNGRALNSILYGQPIVMDCGYESYMTRKETKYCARQLKLSFAMNRIHDNPFNMYLCNADTSGDLMKALNRFIPPLYNTEFPMNVEPGSYLDLFDRDRLVYLTPHCQDEMKHFDHDAVYIIGAFVDKSSNEPVSLAKAKKEGLKMLKLPLDRYLQWGTSSGKNLTLNAVLSILLDIKKTGSWTQALTHVPRRKLYESREAKYNRRLERVFHSTGKNNEHDASGDSDPDSSTSDDDEITPLREIGPKAYTRFNEAPRSNIKSRVHYRSAYPSVARTTDRRNSMKDMDFTMEARMNMKKNWKN